MKMQKSVKHHLPEAVIAAYSAGTLPEAYALVVAAHASLCDACRADIASYEAVGGAVLQEGDTAELAPDALAATMALIETNDDEKPKVLPSKSMFPAPLEAYVGGGPDKVRWQRLGGGMKQAILPCDGDATARLIYIPAGMAMPDHSHRGLELTLVLQGAFSDEVDRFERGDIEVGDEDLSHTPVAEAGADCICLAATDAPLKFKGLLPRLFQPFVRI